jgi:hypothetical protein
MDINRSQIEDNNENENNDDNDDEENENNEMIIDDDIIPPAILLNEGRPRRNAVRPERFRGTPPNQNLVSVPLNNRQRNASKCSCCQYYAKKIKFNGLVKFLLRENEKEHGLTYVGISRVLACEQIDIGPGCSLERLTTKISSGSRLKVRLIEDKRLNVSYDNCKDF